MYESEAWWIGGGKEGLFNKFSWKNNYPYKKKKEIGSLTHTMIKINHREIKDLKIKSKKFKLLVANMDKYVSGFWLVKEFLRHRKY